MAKARAKAPDDEVDDEASKSDLEESRMPFLSHLRELRDRVRNASIFFMLGFAVSWYFARDLFNWLLQPLKNVWDVKKLGPFHVSFMKLTEGFWVDMSIGMWAGIFVSSPFIFYQLWRFIAPGLYKRERRITIAFATFSGLFFTAGALFCYYFVLDNLYGFLLGYATQQQTAVIAMQEYLDLTRDMMLAFGAVFELPLLILFLSMVGMVTHRGLWKFNRWFVVIAFVIGAILTPSPDVVSQIMMATPMIILYNVSILLAWYVTSKREKAEAIVRERERIADEKERAERRAKGLPDRDEDEDDDDDDDDD
ncbi:MAG: Sec-independent protein translocase, TatC subunit [Deltaproteobacteria bacterium]|nr:Sec-independent protein translocase, TatC subunit [Deltaproteobacteria bacterium]